MTPAIEQAVIEQVIEYISETPVKCTCGDFNPHKIQCDISKAKDIITALTSLRAITEPSKTDDELARELAFMVLKRGYAHRANDDWNVTINPCAALITQAFTAIRAQARSEALEEVERINIILPMIPAMKDGFDQKQYTARDMNRHYESAVRHFKCAVSNLKGK